MHKPYQITIGKKASMNDYQENSTFEICIYIFSNKTVSISYKVLIENRIFSHRAMFLYMVMWPGSCCNEST